MSEERSLTGKLGGALYRLPSLLQQRVTVHLWEEKDILKSKYKNITAHKRNSLLWNPGTMLTLHVSQVEGIFFTSNTRMKFIYLLERSLIKQINSKINKFLHEVQSPLIFSKIFKKRVNYANMSKLLNILHSQVHNTDNFCGRSFTV